MSDVGRNHTAGGQGNQTVIAREECSVCGSPWPYDKRSRKRTHSPCAGSRKVIRHYVSLDAAVAAIIERYCDTSRGILCSDFRQAADFLREEFGSVSGVPKEHQP